METLGFLGGTGPLGRGLGLRLAQAGHRVLIGSRRAERAAEAAEKVLAKDAGVDVTGVENPDAAEADIVFVTVPYEAMEAALPPLAGRVSGKLVVSCVNALEADDRGLHPVLLEAGSAAETVAELLPETRVVGAFHCVSATQLLRVPESVEADVPVVGDDEDAREAVISLAARIPGVRGVHAGPLRLARPLEEMVAVLIAVNRRHKAHASIRLTGLDEALA